MSLMICFYLTNSADPDEMPPYAEFHLGLHCLPKFWYPELPVLRITGIQNEKG